MKLDRIIGVSNTKLVYREGDLCVKVFCGNQTKAQILREALCHACAEEAGAMVPELFGVTQIEEKWAITSKYIHGTPLEQRLREQPEAAGALIARLAKAHREVHLAPGQALPEVREALWALIRRAALSESERSRLRASLDRLPAGEQLLHGDFQPSNVLLTAEDAAYIVDWPHAAQGDPAADVARTYLLLRLDRDGDTAEAYLQAYCAASGMAPGRMRAWMPAVAAAHAAGGNARSQAFMLDWVRKALDGASE